MPEKIHTKFKEETSAPVLQNGDRHDIIAALQESPNVLYRGSGKRQCDRSSSPLPSGPKQAHQHRDSAERIKSKLHKNEHNRSNTTTQFAGDVLGGKALMAGTKRPVDDIDKAHEAVSKKKAMSLYDRPRNGSRHKDALQLEKARKALPIWPKREDICEALRENDVLLLNGETGSGKSTQVPQFLYEEPWCKKQKVRIESQEGASDNVWVGGMIAITQPRRVAAITLASRVAREMGQPLAKGTRGEVGYSVRFESILPIGARIKFLTEGMLLQEMLHDPNLRKYSAVIVDEIHERSMDVDLIAGFLRMIVHGDKIGRGGVPLKVVVMSATFDLGGIEAFFARPRAVTQYKPGKNHGRILAPHLLQPNNNNDVESDESVLSLGDSWNGISDPKKLYKNRHLHNPPPGGMDSPPERLTKKMPTHKDLESTGLGIIKTSTASAVQSGVAVQYVQGRQFNVEIIYQASPPVDYLRTVLQTTLLVHIKEPLPGDILVFLTGQDEIDTLKTELESHAEKLVKTLPKMKVMPLYGALSAQAQQDAFERIKTPFTRKIVLATNIAETSVTVSGVRYVIDCGKSKVKKYRSRLGMESLLVKPISKVSAIQRAGRAGREAEGKCFRMYTEKDYLELQQDEMPEILRCDVVEAVLKMKARGITDVAAFPLMDSPDYSAILKALLHLHSIDALNDNGNLTNAGTRMASFPLPASYGRVLVAAAEVGSELLLDSIDVISCLTTDSEIFNQAKSDEEQESLEENRKDIQGPEGVPGRGGDILAYLTAMQHYAAEATDRSEWCRRRLISARAMKMAMQIRKQLRQMCISQRMLVETPPSDPQPLSFMSSDRAEMLLKTFLVAFATKTALLGSNGVFVTTHGRTPITIHPSSVLYGQRKLEGIMFLDHVFTTKSYARKVSPIQANWVEQVLRK